MKITGTSSYILVEIDNKVLKISGELTATPAFYADLSSIKNWEIPFESVQISESERQSIVAEILAYCSDKEMKIYFE
ncbi:MAG TPA: Imm74 family immunity protein [Flavobacteriales bacterium]|nr:Imm74 family immunity protein [Flavobacteriales bacterium]